MAPASGRPAVTDLRWGSATDIGLVRANNQDQLLVAAPLFAVADGMGGHAAGEVASALACEALGRAFEAAGPPSAAALGDAAHQANQVVYDRAGADPELHGMGTTLVAVALVENGSGDCLAVANVGDSRVYMLRDGEIRQVTKDHSLVAELVAEGQIAPEEAERHPQRHVLSRALGVYPDVEVDLTVVAPRRHDRFLLCSDGLSREVSDDQIASVLRRLADPDEAARALIEQAKARGGADNITVVVVDVVDAPDQADAGRAAGPGDSPTLATPAVSAAAAKTTAASPGDTTTTPAASVAAARPAGPAAASPAARPATAGPAGPSRRDKRRQARAARPRGAPILTVRFVAFLIALLAVATVAVGGVELYARSSYYVGLVGGELTIYQGRPGGVLWINPTVVTRTGVTTAQIEPRHLGELNAGQVEPGLGAARRYVANLRAEEQNARQGGSAQPRGAP